MLNRGFTFLYTPKNPTAGLQIISSDQYHIISTQPIESAIETQLHRHGSLAIERFAKGKTLNNNLFKILHNPLYIQVGCNHPQQALDIGN